MLVPTPLVTLAIAIPPFAFIAMVVIAAAGLVVVTMLVTFEGKKESESRVPVQVIPMKPLTSQETESFIEFHSSSISDFGL